MGYFPFDNVIGLLCLLMELLLLLVLRNTTEGSEKREFRVLYMRGAGLRVETVIYYAWH